MIDILASSAEILSEAGFTSGRVLIEGRTALAFEDATILGFLFAYRDSRELGAIWDTDAKRAISAYQFGLRRSGQKAWNVYIVCLATGDVDHSQSVALLAIEEDLVGTRKIARAGISDAAGLRAALLTLLPLQTAPKLDAVDFLAEIRQRATELKPRELDAFLSTAEDALVIQVLEEDP